MIDLKKISRGKESRPPRVLVYSFEGIGKAQPIDAQVLTPFGFVSMGELIVGDLVIGRNGSPCAVIGVFPQGSKLVYRVTMTDGAETECCDDHLWLMQAVDDKSPSVRRLS